MYFSDYLATASANDKSLYTSKDGWLIGIGWALLTIAFEFATGLAGGNTVAELLAAYNPFP